MTELKRTLGLAECVFFGVGSILGAGIYTLIGKVAGWSGNMIWVSFLCASVTAICTAFSYAELSAAFPRSGGEYVYARKAFGKTTGIVLGIIIALNGVISSATVSIGFAGYFVKLAGGPLLISSLGILVVLYLVNVSGIRHSSTVNIIFTIIEMIGLGMVIYYAYPSIGSVSYTELPPQGINGLLAGGALAFFAYIGFEDIVKLAEETRNPEKNIPKALFWATIIVITVYTFVSLCAVSAMPYDELQKTKDPLAQIVGTGAGNTGVLIITIIALFSTSNTILANMIGSSRILFHMAKETGLKRLSSVSEKRRTPVGALTLILIVMAAFALIGDIEIVARIATAFIFLTFIIINLSVIVLRKKDKEMNRPYRIPVNIRNIPVVSVLAILLILVLLGYNIYTLLFSEMM